MLMNNIMSMIVGLCMVKQAGQMEDVDLLVHIQLKNLRTLETLYLEFLTLEHLEQDFIRV